MNGMKYTDEMKQFILENYKGKGNQELTDLFNQKFNTKITKERSLVFLCLNEDMKEHKYF